ncbi:hypothetical protein [Terrimonas alba]|uniref:hypothetical protein n=1 Tax=Terrimonas alba TaxID=3349636 RepID=UPI0035F3E40E
MLLFRKYCLFVLFAVMMVSCKSKKPSLSGEDPVEIADFIDFFPAAKLPYQVADSTLLRKEKDSLLISYKVFTQFVPDSILTQALGKTTKIKIYPLARIDGDETYLFAKTIAGNKRAALILGFDKKQQFIAGMPFLKQDDLAATQQAASIDTRYSIYKTILKKNANGTVSEGKDVYVLNSGSKSFMLIMTDALDDRVSELTNPIDTFSRKQKYTADYGSGKMNLVSFRDGRKNDRLSFFIHFEKNNGECTGELKGEAIIKSPTLAEYREGGDPCVLQFKFSSSAVTIKEIDACGSRRGLRCSFDGIYPRKKEAKPKPVKAKKPK